MSVDPAPDGAATGSSRSSVFGWALAGTVYFLAVLHRTSLGVAGLLAEQRYGISRAQLSIFIFLQIGVYAAMQVPTGVLVDRYGPRRVLVAASALLGAGQLLFALVPSYPAALFARALLGCGDALTFVSVLRFTAMHFSAKRYPVLVALTGMLGMAGNIVATLPLALLLHHVGWGLGFGSAAILSLVAGAVVALLLPDTTPTPHPIRDATELRAAVVSVVARVREAWALPGTRLGFWVHFACMSAATPFSVLWGNSYLIRAAGFDAAQAGAVLMYGVIAAAVMSPLHGWLIGHKPVTRVPLAFGICVITIIGWIVAATAFGDRPPQLYVLILFIVMGLGPPLALAAFALARDYNRSRALGTASGVVNVGGFAATVLTSIGIGWMLNLLGGTSAHTLRWAVLVAVAVQAIGTLRVAVWFRRVRAFALDQQIGGQVVPVPVVRRRWDIGE